MINDTQSTKEEVYFAFQAFISLHSIQDTYYEQNDLKSTPIFDHSKLLQVINLALAHLDVEDSLKMVGFILPKLESNKKVSELCL